MMTRQEFTEWIYNPQDSDSVLHAHALETLKQWNEDQDLEKTDQDQNHWADWLISLLSFQRKEGAPWE